jgi:hypothetical protein
LPSENAPAPPQPHNKPQRLQFTHFGEPSLIGHFLFSIFEPLSTKTTFQSGFKFIISKAAKIQAGPAPIMATLYIIFPRYFLNPISIF